MRTAIPESETAEESVISVKNESREKKGFIFLAASRRLLCACDWKLFNAWGAKRTVPSILVTLVGTVGIFSAPAMSVFASWHHRSKMINTGREGAQLFVGIMCTARGVPTYLREKLVNHEPKARDLQAFLVFSQHPKWVITPINP